MRYAGQDDAFDKVLQEAFRSVINLEQAQRSGFFSELFLLLC